MEILKILKKGFSELGIKAADDIPGKFETYLHELKKWNRAYNLTALKDDEEIITKHFLDSLLYLKVIPEGQLSICDIGSGAGFPGIPMAIVRPELTVALIEPSRKKTAFLRHMKNRLSLQNIEVIESRIEDVKDRLFDIAVTRALFSVGDLIKKAGHILKEDGFFVLNKGPKFEDEIKDISGDVKFEIFPIALPGASLQRNLIKVYFKR
ncbi:MAG: 16S rRNA (guanine(527)-N(7))-methyltransferase RsmG [Nitrospirae bacterium]|nr:16S rRNA (guanine(527)-N(7))-methyltransferase RsmG [Nitrospirota bacterium]MCL5977715.1 16S rRNA (guanine(527)-N(7))-methyltransferase RsmG [Nitrospirota bacterium]